MRRRPHTIDESFRIASVTKQLTALLAMQEVERGRLQLDAPLERTLPGLPAAVAPITLRQLLKNTSGLPNLDAIPNAHTRVDAPMDDLPAYLRVLPLAPLVTERIVAPLRLRATGGYAADVPASHVKGYEDDNGRLVDETIGRLTNFGPAGAMYSTFGRSDSVGPRAAPQRVARHGRDVLANTNFAALFDLYSRRGLPYELLSLAATRAA